MSKRTKFTLSFFSIIIIGLLLPQKLSMPVEGATNADYNKDTFWHYPWGKSVTHKGVDIFAKQGTPINASITGLVLFAGEIQRGGKVVLILGPKWRLHYYAHLKHINTKSFTWVNRNDQLGSVGSSGNAVGKPPHLHYSILTIIPYPWRIDSDKQGWKKMFYLNPIDYLRYPIK